MADYNGGRDFQSLKREARPGETLPAALPLSLPLSSPRWSGSWIHARPAAWSPRPRARAPRCPAVSALPGGLHAGGPPPPGSRLSPVPFCFFCQASESFQALGLLSLGFRYPTSSKRTPKPQEVKSKLQRSRTPKKSKPSERNKPRPKP